MAVDHVHVLGVLPADLEDRVDRRVDVRGARNVRGDLVDNGVGADNVADNLPAASGGAHAQDVEWRALAGRERPQRPQEQLGRRDGITGRLPVDVGDDVARFVDQDGLGAGRADVDAQIGADRFAFAPARDAHLVAVRVLVALLGGEGRMRRLLERERPGKPAVFIGPHGLAFGREHQAVSRRLRGEGGAIRRHQLRLLRHVDEAGAVVLEPAHDLLVQRDPADQHGLALERPPVEQRAEDRTRHAAAQARPHVHPAAAFLLAVDQIAFREHRAAGGDSRRIGIVQVAPGVLVGDPQTARLFVEERAGAGGAHRIGRVALELALAVELDERGRPAADVHHGEGIRRNPADGVNLAQCHVAVGHLQLRREQLGVAAREPDRVGRLDVQAVQRLGQDVGRLASVPLVDGGDNPASLVQPDSFEKERTDVDTDRCHRETGRPLRTHFGEYRQRRFEASRRRARQIQSRGLARWRPPCAAEFR